MIYLASPYSGNRSQMHLRYVKAVEYCAKIISTSGSYIFSPIVHWHPAAQNFNLPTDAKFWEDYNHHILSKCEKMIVLKLPGWQESLGVQAEIKFATEHSIPIFYDEIN